MEPKTVVALIVFVVPCILSANQISYQHRVTFGQLTPTEEGCKIFIWFVDTSKKCIWCEFIFNSLIRVLTNQFNPSMIYKASTHFTRAKDFGTYKGTCFVNYVIVNPYQFPNINGISWSIETISSFEVADWFIFIQVSSTA